MENIYNKQKNKNKRGKKRVKNNILLDSVQFAFRDSFSEEVTDFFHPTNISRIIEEAGKKGYDSSRVTRLWIQFINTSDKNLVKFNNVMQDLVDKSGKDKLETLLGSQNIK